jgi:apolipoprotein N-acyltransferase
MGSQMKDVARRVAKLGPWRHGAHELDAWKFNVWKPHLWKLGGWKRAAVSFAAGLGSAAAFAPLHFWPVLFVTFPVLVWLLDGAASAQGMLERLRQAAAIGWFAGAGYFLGGLYWVGAAFLVEPEKFALLLPLAITALPAGLALFWAFGAALAQALWRPGAARVAAFALGLFAAEWLRGHLFTGFPWNLAGSALAGNAALLQGASLVGVYGLSLLSLFVFASPAAIFDPADATRRPRRARWLTPVIGGLILLTGEGWGAWRLANAANGAVDGVRLRLVQANIPQTEKWKPENRQWIFDRYLQLSVDGGSGEKATSPVKTALKPTTLVIWPESSVPFLFMMNGAVGDAASRERLGRILSGGTTLLLGAERAEAQQQPDGRYRVSRVFNSLFYVEAGSKDNPVRVRDTYDKIHLTPFGEYVPFEKTLNSLGVRKLTHLPFSFTPGTKRISMSVPGAPPFSPLICYEVIFPGEVGAAGLRPQWILNVTNDAWFGVSSGPYQHLDQAKMRAVEEGIPVVRAANTGISAVIDGYGRLKASLPLNQMGVIDSPLPISLTPPLNTSWGNWTLSVIIIVVLAYYRIIPKIEGSGPAETVTRKP